MSEIRATSYAETCRTNAALATEGTPAQIAGSRQVIEAFAGVAEDASAPVAANAGGDDARSAGPGGWDLCADCRNQAFGTTILRVGQTARALAIAERRDIMETACAVRDSPVAELMRKARLQQACMGL